MQLRTASMRTPKEHLAESLIRISSNPAISKSDTDEQVSFFARAVLSRSTLRMLIQNYGLYPEKRAKMPLEDVVAKMKEDIAIRPVPVAPLSSGARVGGLSVQSHTETRSLPNASLRTWCRGS